MNRWLGGMRAFGRKAGFEFSVSYWQQKFRSSTK